MAPVIFNFLGRQVGSTLAGFMVALRIRHPAPKTMPMLLVRKPRSASSARRRRNSAHPKRRRNNVGFAEKSRKPRMKAHRATPEPSQMPDIPAPTVAFFDTCPSCGLQAPESLLAEHFLGSPSHKDGPPKIVKVETVKTEAPDDPRRRIQGSRLEICCRCLFLRERLAVAMLTDRWVRFPRLSKTWVRRTGAFRNHNTSIFLGEDITQNKPQCRI